MNDKITIYYYTAWDGYAWQGCDKATAVALTTYIEATRTLPTSSAVHPPFGGAVSCLIAGVAGVAVYRYHVRLRGDLSGRDSLYIALAFVPLDIGCVDFAKLLELPQLAAPKSGELRPETLSASDLELRLRGAGEEPQEWLDRDVADTKYRVLRGREGLHALARLFFSKYAQLGFLNAVFRCRSGLDDLVSNQTYAVYPEVSKVVAASEALGKAGQSAGGASDAAAGMRTALGELGRLASRYSAYPGLKAYHDAKSQELDGNLVSEAAHAQKTAAGGRKEEQSETARLLQVSSDLARQLKEAQQEIVEILQRSNDLAKRLKEAQLESARLLETSNGLARQMRQMRDVLRGPAIDHKPQEPRWRAVLNVLKIVGLVILAFVVFKMVFGGRTATEGRPGAGDKILVDLEVGK